jgi:hypothetical protein
MPCLNVGRWLGVLALLGILGCSAEDPLRAEALAALERSVVWLQSHPVRDGAALGERGMDAWTWELIARLHPDEAVRARVAREARTRLAVIELEDELDQVGLSWWSLLMRCRTSLGLDNAPIVKALTAHDLEAILEQGAPTTAFWTAELLSRSGVALASRPEDTVLAQAALASRREVTLRDAYAFYHELAPASDLNRQPIRAFDAEQLAYARALHPNLLAESIREGDADAVAEVLVSAVIINARGPEYRAGIAWLLAKQQEDGTYLSPKKGALRSQRDPRHLVLVATWALLEFLASSP